MMKVMNEEKIESQHREMWDLAIAEHGAAHLVPRDQAQKISDEIRARYCVEYWDRSINLVSHLRQMMVSEDLIARLVAESGVEIQKDESGKIVIEKKQKRRRDDLLKDLMAWLDANPYKIVSVKDLCEIGKVAHMTIRKFIVDRPDYFRPGEKRGEWEIRNPKEERDLDRNRS
jgi:hypothetical protein